MESPQNKDGAVGAVGRVSWSALFAAFFLTMAFLYVLSQLEVPSSQLPSSLQCGQLTDAGIERLGCRALQVAAALLAFTIAGHFIYAAAGHPLRVADPRPILFGICVAVGMVVFAVGDISSFFGIGREE